MSDNFKDFVKEPLTLEKRLESFQGIDPVYKQLYAEWQIVRINLTKILNNIVLVFPHYSLHDATHSETIVHRIEAVLGEKRIQKLYPTEIWLFLMSAYTHDIGMLISDKEIHKLWNSDDFSDYVDAILTDKSYPDLKQYAKEFRKKDKKDDNTKDWAVSVKWAAVVLTADYCRKFHPERSRKIVTGAIQEPVNYDFSFRGFIPHRILNLLGKIDELHGKNFSDILSLNYRCQGLGLFDDIVYPRRVAAMLRLGDLLDMDDGRFDKNAFTLLGAVPETTLYHQEKESALTHFLVADNCIEAEFACKDEGTYEAASSWMNWLKEETENLALYWNDIVPDDFGSAPILKNPKTTLRGKSLKGDSLQQFSVNNKDFFELLEGANIYKNRFSCIRELIQNAEDATKIRLWEDIQRGEVDPALKEKGKDILPFDIPFEIYNRYEIQVTFKYDSKKNIYHIVVQDHGIGITDEVLEQLGKVGSSWHEQGKNKKFYKNMPAWLQPTGAFGVGLQSVFMITDKLDCKTAPRSERAKYIQLRSRKKGGRITNQDLDNSTLYPEGSTFSFDILPECFNFFSYHLGGEYDEALNQYDPFDIKDLRDLNNKNFLNLYYLVDCLFDDVFSSYFPIHILIEHDSKELQKVDIPRHFECKHKEGEKIPWNENIIIYSMSKNTGNSFIVYNVKYSITYHLILEQHRRPANITLNFKGMTLSTKYISQILGFPYDFMFLEAISLDGMPTQEWLVLNREHIRQEKAGELMLILREDLLCALKFIYQKIVDQGKNICESLTIDSVKSLFGLTEAFLNTELDETSEFSKMDSLYIEKARNALCELMQKDNQKIGIGQMTDEGYRPSEKALGDFLKQIFEAGKSFWLYEEHPRNPYFAESNIMQIATFAQELQKNNKIEINPNEDFVSTNTFFKFFSNQFLRVKKVYASHEGLLLYYCDYRKEEMKAANELPELSKDALNYLYSKIINYPRMISCAIQNFSSLAVNEIPRTLYNSNHQFIPFVLEKFPLMIFPFNNGDIAELKNKQDITSDDIWSKIHDRNDFKNLVKYVKENNYNPKITETDIIGAYHELIKQVIEYTKR